MKSSTSDILSHRSPRISPGKAHPQPRRNNNSIHDGTFIKLNTSDTNMNTTGNTADQPSLAVSRAAFLEKDMERRQETYIARERAYKSRIEELEEEISILKDTKTEWMKKDPKISKLRQMQGQILSNIELVQDRTAHILQEQERDLLKAFRARLYDVQTELEKEKTRKDDGAGAWIDRCNTLTAELEWSKGVADRLERVNQALMQDNSRLKSEYASQEEDRNFIISQLVAVKKENTRLRTEYSALEAELSSTKQKLDKNAEESTSKTQGVFGMRSSNNNKTESEEKYKDINVRLKRLLTDERKSLQNLRQSYSADLKSRSDLELLLRQCVEDVRKEIAHRKVEAGLLPNHNDQLKLYSRVPGAIPVNEFSKEDRERTLELLLSQERVITLLYAKVFPLVIKDLVNAPGNDFNGDNMLRSPTNNQLGTSSLCDGTSVSRALLDKKVSYADIDSGSDYYNSSSRPQSSRMLGTPGERDRERGREKLPSIPVLSSSGLVGTSFSRPSTGGRA